MISRKSILIISSLVVISLAIGSFAHNTTVVNAKVRANNEKVQQMLRQDYNYDLTKLIVLRKNSTEPELVILEDLKPHATYDSSGKLKKLSRKDELISSANLRVQNNDLSKNLERFEKLENKLTELLNDESVEYAQPNYLYTTQAWSTADSKDTPNDFGLDPDALNGNHWYYEKSKLRELWNKQGCATGGESCGGSSEVVVAVIDTGLAFEDRDSAWVDQNNTPFNFDALPDMFSGMGFNLWVNGGEIANNHIDDDGNGFVDDYHGFNAENDVDCFLSNNCLDNEGYYLPELLAESGHPNDDGGHGTYVTGLIASKVNNGVGSVSPAHNVVIMPIKANDYKSPYFGSIEVWAALHYAQINGADIVNMSIGGASPDPLWERKINELHDDGILVIAASGNEFGGVDYPAKYSSVIAVGAVNADESRSDYSNYGPELDLVAYVGDERNKGGATYQSSYSCFTSDPDCFSSANLNRYTQFSNQYAVGTSFAAPQVAAAAAIILGNNPGISVDELKMALILSVDDLGSPGFDNQTGHGVINYKKAGDMIVSDIENTAYFTAYRDGPPKYKAWVIVGNPSLDENLNAAITHKGNNGSSRFSTIAPNNRTSISFPDANGGPIRVIADAPFYATIKSEVNGGPDETKGFSRNELATKFYYPAYRDDGSKYKAWIMVGNPNNQPVEVEVVHSGTNGGAIIQTIEANSRGTFKFNGATGGPVVVRSTDNSSLIYTTIKSEVNGLPDESEGISVENLSTKFYFPAYRNQPPKYKAWIIVGNPGSEAVDVVVENSGINGGVRQSIIEPGGRYSFSYDNANGGPVSVRSVDGTSLLYATIKSEVNNGPDETSGISVAEMDSKYFLPAYRDQTPRYKAWIIVGNPNENPVNVEVTHLGPGGGVQNALVDEGSRYAFKFSGATGGPVIINSSGGDIYVTLKSEVDGLPDETSAIPNKSL